jgi:hypothetical protein
MVSIALFSLSFVLHPTLPKTLLIYVLTKVLFSLKGFLIRFLSNPTPAASLSFSYLPASLLFNIFLYSLTSLSDIIYEIRAFYSGTRRSVSYSNNTGS